MESGTRIDMTLGYSKMIPSLEALRLTLLKRFEPGALNPKRHESQCPGLVVTKTGVLDLWGSLSTNLFPDLFPFIPELCNSLRPCRENRTRNLPNLI